MNEVRPDGPFVQHIDILRIGQPVECEVLPAPDVKLPTLCRNRQDLNTAGVPIGWRRIVTIGITAAENPVLNMPLSDDLNNQWKILPLEIGHGLHIPVNPQGGRIDDSRDIPFPVRKFPTPDSMRTSLDSYF